MAEWLQYGAFGLLTLVLLAVGATAKIFVERSLKELDTIVLALNRGMDSLGIRMDRLDAGRGDDRHHIRNGLQGVQLQILDELEQRATESKERDRELMAEIRAIRCRYPGGQTSAPPVVKVPAPPIPPRKRLPSFDGG